MVKINVTAKDIEKGVYESIYLCPVARAIKRATKGIQPAVFPKTVVIDGLTFGLPEQATEFINEYDRGNEVKPFSFKMEL